MSGTEKKDVSLFDIHAAYLAYPDPYKDPPICKFDHHALACYAKEHGKSVSELSMEEKLKFLKQ